MFKERNGKETLSLAFRDTRKKAKKTPPDDSGVPELVAGVSCQQPSSDSENDQSMSASVTENDARRLF